MRMLSRIAFNDFIRNPLREGPWENFKRGLCCSLPASISGSLAPLISAAPSDRSSRQQFLFSQFHGYTPGFTSLHVRGITPMCAVFAA